MHKHFDYVLNMVCDLRQTSSTKDKENIIIQYCENNDTYANFTKNILLYTYHPLWQYNVTSENLKKKNHLRGDSYNNIFDLLDALKSRTITGHDAIGAVNSFVIQYPEYEELIHCIIDKDLKTRAGDKIINKAIQDHIPEFSVALADKYEPKLVDWKDGWYVSRKIDGARCIGIVDSNGDTIFYSRTGKEFDTLGIVRDAIKTLNVTDVVFDGELCLVDDEGNEDFQGVMKQLKKKDHTIPNPCYKIFDMISHDEFYSKRGESNKPFGLRLNNLINILKCSKTQYLNVVHQERIKHDEHFAEWCVESSKNGWEGLMLRADEPYKGKRSKDLLKYKNFFDDEYTVIDTKMGPFRYIKDGKEVEETMLSNVTISHKGHNVDVGSGFTIEERQAFFKNPDLILGKTITVQYFEETKNQDGGISLRFPTFKYAHGENREV